VQLTTPVQLPWTQTLEQSVPYQPAVQPVQVRPAPSLWLQLTVPVQLPWLQLDVQSVPQ